MTIRRAVPSLLLVLGACGPGEPPQVKSDKPRDERGLDDVQLAPLIAGNTEFALALYQASAAEPGNVFMSPYSISLALGMTYAGAAGETASQIATAMHFDLPPVDFHAAMNALDLALASREDDAPSGFRLRSASSMWGQQDYPFVSTFLDTLAVNYGAGIYISDFIADPDGSRDTINDWVSNRTAGKIDELLPTGVVTGRTRLVLTNAIYFKAAWEQEFDTGDTEDAPFATPGGSVTVPTMHIVSEELGYGTGPRFRAVELKYSVEDLSMVVILPELLPDETGDPLALLEAELSAAKLAEITDSIVESYLHVALPKFELKATLPLGARLQAMGMTDAFDDALADFSGIDGTRDLYIHAALHQAWVQVNESGTEAAAATAVVIGDDAPDPEPEQFIVDRPFLFLIRDVPTGAILFIGRVVDPS